jgi:hypothetical protein
MFVTFNLCELKKNRNFFRGISSVRLRARVLAWKDNGRAAALAAVRRRADPSIRTLLAVVL